MSKVYQYGCRNCRHHWQREIVRRYDITARCPECESQDILRLPAGARLADPDSGKLPWWRDGSVAGDGLHRQEKPIDIKSIKDTEAYIFTGEKR